jgi:hypothetical protein
MTRSPAQSSVKSAAIASVLGKPKMGSGAVQPSSWVPSAAVTKVTAACTVNIVPMLRIVKRISVQRPCRR